jgi:oligopeptide transport system ATP-binding protein
VSAPAPVAARPPPPPPAPWTGPLVEANKLEKFFPLTRSFSEWTGGVAPRQVHAVDGVTFSIGPRETLGLIGESGSGKTTLGWLMAKLHRPTAGTFRFEGQDVTRLDGERLRHWRRNVQIVFQDPVGSLDPRLKVWQIVGEPLRAQGINDKARVRQMVRDLLPTVGLPPDCLDQYPHEFSGGGRQRLSLARAFSVNPKLIVLDEPTSALDVAVQAQILNRLVDIQRERTIAYLLITHNVAAVRYVADRVAVMYLGRIVEMGSVRGVLEKPLHPYTKALLAAVPVADAKRRRTLFRIGGDVPSLVNPKPGCRFAPRCPFVIQKCRDEYPELRPIPGGPPGQLAACHRAEEVINVGPAEFLATTDQPSKPIPAATAETSATA